MKRSQGREREDSTENWTPQPSVNFACSLCGLRVDGCRNISPGSEKDKKERSNRTSKVIFLEDVFAIDDPFSENKNVPLAVGGFCCICNASVCMNQDCSIYYTRRFCIQCAKENIARFPAEMEKEIKKRKFCA
uniref:Cysteine-rich DPF motif domain-containing protein 1 n=1 Tax=Carukia barnesi TaxID=168717 RepID=B3VCD2_CARBN|nr:BJA-10 [Carukia barnesi]